MTLQSGGEITQLLVRWRDGDSSALDPLMKIVYAELHALASSYLRRERPDHTLQASALVHEAYLRLIGQRPIEWTSRTHFFGIAARTMRHILIEHARAHQFEKRGGGVKPLPLDEALTVSLDRAPELIALDDALGELADLDQQQAQIVELRFFAGLTNDEIGRLLGVSTRTVIRSWNLARAWLFRELERSQTIET